MCSLQSELKADCPYMCAYKLVTVKFKWWGLQTKVENFIHRVTYALLSHQIKEKSYIVFKYFKVTEVHYFLFLSFFLFKKKTFNFFSVFIIMISFSIYALSLHARVECGLCFTQVWWMWHKDMKETNLSCCWSLKHFCILENLSLFQLLYNLYGILFFSFFFPFKCLSVFHSKKSVFSPTSTASCSVGLTNGWVWPWRTSGGWKRRLKKSLRR